MNMLYIIIVVLVITNSSYAFATPIISRAYDIASERFNNTSINEIVPRGFNNFPPVGFLDVKYPDRAISCTATIINSKSGNVGLTAAHCLFDYTKKAFPIEINFHPGYNRGDSNFGKVSVPIKNIAILQDVQINNPVDDYGMFRVDFGGNKLQSKTGALNVDLNPPASVNTVVFGYPKSGAMPNCPKDGQTFCAFIGTSVKTPAYRGVPIDVGNGASGGPWISKSAKNLIGVSSTFIQHDGKTAAAVWTTNGFNQMLKFIDVP
jgi:V8-like Glu-specific endopeptidase